jgi:hypothetical protein
MGPGRSTCHLRRKKPASPGNGPGVDSWGRPSPRNGPIVDSWKRPQPGVGEQGAALAVQLATCKGKRPPTAKNLSDDARKGHETMFFLEREARKGSRDTVFSRTGGPGTKFGFRDQAVPLAICRGKRPLIPEIQPVSFRERTSSTTLGRATKQCFFSSGRPLSKMLHQGAVRPTCYLWRKTPSDSKEPRRRPSDGPRNSVFSRVGGPKTKCYIRDRAVPLAICRGKRHPALKMGPVSSRVGGLGLDRARNGPAVDPWKRPQPGVGEQGAALAVPLATCQGRRPPTGKNLSDDARKGHETMSFLEREARKGHETRFFLEQEAPAPIWLQGPGRPTCYLSRKAATLAICRGKRHPALEMGPVSSRGGGPGGPGPDRARNGPAVDSWKRPQPGVGGQGAALAVPLAICGGKMLPTRKNVVDDSRKGYETEFFLEREARNGHETLFFLEREAPAPNFTSGTGPSHSLFTRRQTPPDSKEPV